MPVSPRNDEHYRLNKLGGVPSSPIYWKETINIYFACSITGGRDYESIYRTISAALISDGHEFLTAHLANPGVKEVERRVPPREIYERDTAWIRICEALVAEVSTPSHGVGYEVAYALSLGKPVLCVFREGQTISKMLSGNSNPTISVKSYRNSEEAIAVIRSFLQGLLLLA